VHLLHPAYPWSAEHRAEFTTACAQACPSDAIVFGNVNDPASRVARVRKENRGYRVLEDLNTRSAITYLAKVVLPREA
jgi:molybdopterin-containing oxidoreductase family iron-sulfur binding subunit